MSLIEQDTFVVEIPTNAEMHSHAVAELLRKIADTLEGFGPPRKLYFGDTRAIQNEDGDTVGAWGVETRKLVPK